MTKKEKKPTAYQLQMEKNRAAVPDVELLIAKHGLAAVRAVITKKSKIEHTERKLAERKEKLEAELSKLKEQLR